MLLALLKTLILLQGGLSPVGQYPADYGPNLKDGDEFDFIIVGAGSAGSVVASRLSEVTEWKVLLLEAGGYPSDLSEIPALAFSLQDSEEDWQFKDVPSESACIGLQNNVCKWPRGKALGGSSTINLMMYTRSTKFDHARWNDGGNDGWDHDSVVKHYKKFESVDIDNNQHYGTEGELHLTRYTSTQPTRQILMNAYEQLGYNEYTEDKPIGFRDMLLSIYQGTRQNAAKAFLIPAKERKNLYLSTNSRVSKVLINREKLKVNGVEVKIGNRIIQLSARKEVILSAGTINSPHILMNSGIGPKEHLNELGIEVVRDLNVGNNLQDHISFPFVVTALDHSAVTPITTLQLVNELYQYFANRQGGLSKIEITNFCSYINTKNNTNDFSNVQIIHTLVQQEDPYVLAEILRAVGSPNDVTQTIIDYNQNFPMLAFNPILLQPKSRGFVRLQNSNPFSNPLIIPNFLNDKNNEDIQVLLESVHLITKLVETEAFSAHKPKIIDPNVTNCKEFVFKSDEFWKCAIKNIGIPMYHPVGTCKMGPESDSSAVVDPQLRIHGIKGVRIIDGSIIPTITSSNTNAPILMIGEKGATLIKEHWITEHDEL